MVLDDLEHLLGQCEANLRETRLLLAQQKHRRAATPEETVAIAAQFFQSMSEAETLASDLNSKLREESAKRTEAIRQRQYRASRKEYIPPASTDDSGFGSDKLFGRDDDEAEGNAPVPAFPKQPVPVLSGGAARRFEESDEPPRNP